ncbi:acyl-CoA thioesterase [Marinospirillum alkaliphilum]|uniref:Thioesterase-3 n=1 Tax=Marinospirillum alkaliphilum DSM 21637 TaxID=1122209 RepID=A0A1K1UFG0_9GAMM|nr:thioesterase family protein [Marinospirillum alkaliphilum]SFX11530.1 thioesterase-3 [Marinospirillum alkaliphilum DSM 21637]
MQTRTPIKIRGYHLDLYGHVNNARYLEFLEEARWDFLEQQVDIATFTGSGLGLAVVNININYRRGAYVNEEIEVVTTLARIGNKSAVMHQDVVLKGTDVLVADADITFVVTDQKAQKAVALEGELRQVLEQWQTLQPAI